MRRFYLHRCRSRGPAVQGATGSGRTWQRRSVTTPPFVRPTRYPLPPTLQTNSLRPCRQRRGFELRAARAHARALAHRISVCALSALRPPSRRGSTAGEASRRRPTLGTGLARTGTNTGTPREQCCAKQEETATLTVIWARQLVNHQPKLEPVPCSREEPAPTSSTRSRGLAERPASWRRGRCQRQTTQLRRDGASGSSRCCEDISVFEILLFPLYNPDTWVSRQFGVLGQRPHPCVATYFRFQGARPARQLLAPEPTRPPHHSRRSHVIRVEITAPRAAATRTCTRRAGPIAFSTTPLPSPALPLRSAHRSHHVGRGIRSSQGRGGHAPRDARGQGHELKGDERRLWPPLPRAGRRGAQVDRALLRHV